MNRKNHNHHNQKKIVKLKKNKNTLKLLVEFSGNVGPTKWKIFHWQSELSLIKRMAFGVKVGPGQR